MSATNNGGHPSLSAGAALMGVAAVAAGALALFGLGMLAGVALMWVTGC